MIGIDWLFVGGASGIVGIALIEKLADEFGFGLVGKILKISLTAAGVYTGFVLFDIIAGAFL